MNTTGRPIFDTVGTLDSVQPGLTCSIDAASRWGRAAHVRGYPTFEAAIADVKRGRLEAALVPAAYPALGSFIMDRDLKAVESLLTRISPLVVVGSANERPGSAKTVFHHTATGALLPEIQIVFEEAVPVRSNPEACEKVCQFPGTAIALTNERSAMFYQLHIYQVLRDNLMMPFICFTRIEEPE